MQWKYSLKYRKIIIPPENRKMTLIFMLRTIHILSFLYIFQYNICMNPPVEINLIGISGDVALISAASRCRINRTFQFFDLIHTHFILDCAPGDKAKRATTHYYVLLMRIENVFIIGSGLAHHTQVMVL